MYTTVVPICDHLIDIHDNETVRSSVFMLIIVLYSKSFVSLCVIAMFMDKRNCWVFFVLTHHVTNAVQSQRTMSVPLILRVEFKNPNLGQGQCHWPGVSCWLCTSLIETRHKSIWVNVHNLVQVADWRSLVKTSLELQSCPLFQINRRPKCHRSVTFGTVY
jgi:hypothetical protein